MCKKDGGRKLGVYIWRDARRIHAGRIHAKGIHARLIHAR